VDRARLEARGVKSWLCMPLGPAGRQLGVFSFEAVSRERRWHDNDIAMLRTAGEIFANAITRDRAGVEREQLEMQLQQAQRLEAIGTLAGGIAHEFNNILGGILGYAEMLLNAVPPGGQPRHRVEQVMNAARRGKGIVDQILDFSRRSDRHHRPVEVQPAVEDALRFLKASLPATVDVRRRLDAGGAAVVGDSGQLQQVVINLCTNAAHASQGRGIIEVALDVVTVAEERALSHGRLGVGSYVRLRVQDRGHGIDRATMEHIFEPFFTTKEIGVGTGLGLSTVHGIVAQHGGGLNVSSRRGEGSAFEVYLPQADERAVPGDQSPARVARGHGETVLIVDDERSLMLLGEEMLAALGYEPVGFDSSAAALAAFHADPQRFDLALTDEVMPSMTGTELAAAMHEIRPDLPVVIMTGYGGPLASQRLQAKDIRDILRKPLVSADIAECLARTLAHGRRRASA
jgi:signal transduction histidine kinase/CheY-like chemotaxis protein